MINKYLLGRILCLFGFHRYGAVGVTFYEMSENGMTDKKFCPSCFKCGRFK